MEELAQFLEQAWARGVGIGLELEAGMVINTMA